MFILESEEGIEEEELENDIEENLTLEEERSEEASINPQISFHAMEGTMDYNSMWVKTFVKGKMCTC